ncbi:MAG: hypothetical protein M3526_04735 [Actinomycetota bacterium]|nr:hypothetical protein [Actinomycetota bacterium]
MTRTHSRRWLSLATALLTLTALLLPLSGGAQATTDNQLDLDVDPEETVAAIGQPHSITFRITTPGGCPDASGCSIDAEVEDADNTPLNPDASCLIGQTLTTCSADFSSNEARVDLIRVWGDDGLDNGTFDADQSEGRSVKSTPGDRPEVDDTDVVAVRWATPGTVTRVDASGEASTTSTTKSHTVTCRLLDGLNFGVDGEVCDANIPKGPNKNDDVDNNAATPGGYLGECTTGPKGYCSFTYQSNEIGTDTVRVFYDRNLDDLKAGEPSDDVIRTWTSDITSGPCSGLNFGQTAPLPGGGKRFAGTLGDNIKFGTPFRDIFCGFAGVDKFDGGPGDDLALGGTGNDTLLGRKGNDELQGSDGNDNLQGAEGGDKIFSGKGNDKTSGGFGNDKVYGDAGIDLVQGFAGDDTLGGGDGADKVKGGGGRDNLAGGSGPDALNGGSGKDNCIGGPGADTLASC